MRSQRPKVLQPLGGRPLLQHVVEAVKKLGEVSVHSVVGHRSEEVSSALGDSCHYVQQPQQCGTADAVARALPALAADSKVLILYGDVPLIQPDTLQAMVDTVDSGSMAVLTTTVANPRGYGRMVRDKGGAVAAIIEEKDASEAERAISEINTGIMCVPQQLLAQWLPQIGNDNAQQEYYLTDIVALAVAQSVVIHTPQPQWQYEVLGVNDRAQLATVERHYQRRCAERVMQQGATLADPARIDIRGELGVGRDVFIDVNTVFSGRVQLGDGVQIGPNCVIGDSEIAAGSEILANSVIEGAVLAERCQVGPFARLRPGATLAAGAKVGNYVEVKNSHLGAGSKANHLSYLGDAEIGAGSNIGAGTITCNYDGANKYKTQLGEGVFIGSNSTLVAPLEIGDGGFVGAGSTITQTVPCDNLAVGRGRQKNLSGWRRPKKK